MRKLRPGYNEEGWRGEIKCVGSGGPWDDKVGCGALLEVTKDDLYTVYVHSIGGARNDVRCLCFCGVENNVPDGKIFTGLPTEKEWKEKQDAQ